jgi:hypothetical protein
MANTKTGGKVQYDDDEKPGTQQELAEQQKKSAVAGIAAGNAQVNKAKQLPPAAFKLDFAGSHSRRFIASVTPDMTREQILGEAFFAHVAAKLLPFDVIELRPIDRTYSAELVVHSAGKLWAKVLLKSYVPMGSQLTESVPEGFSVDFTEKFGWRALRGSEVLKDRFELEAQAVQWIIDHRKAMAA